LSLTAGLL